MTKKEVKEKLKNVTTIKELREIGREYLLTFPDSTFFDDPDNSRHCILAGLLVLGVDKNSFYLTQEKYVMRKEDILLAEGSLVICYSW